MRGGLAIILGGAAMAAAGCAAKSGQVQVRAIADPAAKLGVGSERIAEARGQLALGNVGLAIEGFHAALRAEPDNVEAMRGLAACYDSMGRTDLSRQYYESALAVAPHDARSLNAFAASVDLQGDHVQATELRTEALHLAAPAVAVAAATPAIAPARIGLPVVIAEVGQSVTIALPPARPAPQPIARAEIRPDGPRLQRLSFGEVALLTAGEPAWRPTIVTRTAQTTTVHWVALNDGVGRPNVRLLNAARSQGLAARTRDYLLARGWRKIEIGDAEAVRESTLVMYPAARQSTGRNLASQFGVRAGMLQQGQEIVVLLGRDATLSKAARVRG